MKKYNFKQFSYYLCISICKFINLLGSTGFDGLDSNESKHAGPWDAGLNQEF